MYGVTHMSAYHSNTQLPYFAVTCQTIEGYSQGVASLDTLATTVLTDFKVGRRFRPIKTNQLFC